MLSIQQLLQQEFTLDPEGLHGPRHWRRVERFGLWLCPHTGADPQVVSWFAWFHDCRRLNETRDPDHGWRGGERAKELLAETLSESQLQLLYLACLDHENGFTSDDATIGTCWDSDRLDFDRAGAILRPTFFSTQTARELAALKQMERLARVGLGRFRDP